MPGFMRFAIFALLALNNNAQATHTRDDSDLASTPTDELASSQPPTLSRTDFGRINIGNATCHSRTANYITHTLPQQCLRTNRASATTSNTTSDISKHVTTSSPSLDSPHSGSATDSPAATAQTIVTYSSDARSETTHPSSESQPRFSTTSSSTGEVPVATAQGPEAETDSPLDNANFLSFEDWKRQNLAKAGQSPENLASHREALDGERRRPGINNALDTLGEESEIELDFSGFGANRDDSSIERPYSGTGETASAESSLKHQTARSKDAGKTCKERTNYASFDCAATILKNNPESKSGSSILVENKDSYMLNTCSAKNKFVIIELCSDILVDTIVLANYEFFSSIFRHFRISVSDRYPVKMEKWKDLGTFEARNTREVQAFLIENPLIWARYLRIEFLTHYGNEYYCPVSLLRVHGTTMMDEFRHQEEIARGESQDDEIVVEPDVPAQTTVSQGFDTEVEEETVQAATSVEKEASETTPVSRRNTVAVQPDQASFEGTSIEDYDKCAANASDFLAIEHSIFTHPTCPITFHSSSLNSEAATQNPSTKHATKSSTDSVASTTPTQSTPHESSAVPQVTTNSEKPSQGSPSTAIRGSSSSGNSVENLPRATSSSTTSVSPSSGTENTNAVPPANRPRDDTTTTGPAKNGAPNANSTRPAATGSTSAQPAQPSTQESFFKSVHKRLQQLESNSTLSLQYIEEQSRILRDAFSKVEKRQVTSTTNFLSNLNSTVMGELQGFRQAYDQLWQSTVIELEGQREQYQREMLALSTRLTLVADELVWQKRMGIVQSTLLLLCLALVLFNRAGSTALVEMPLLQQMMNKSQAALRAGWESPPGSRSPENHSPENRSPVSLFRKRLWRHSTEPVSGHRTDATDSRPQSRSAMDLDGRPEVLLEPPTPPGEEVESDDESDWKEVPEVQSGPATPRGTRESLGSPTWPEEHMRPSSSLG
ncbi:hypothetical protein Q7P37_005139 [Cladosporium fusiforme]